MEDFQYFIILMEIFIYKTFIKNDNKQSIGEMCIRDRNNRLTIGKNTKVTESEMWKIEEIVEFQDRQAQETIIEKKNINL